MSYLTHDERPSMWMTIELILVALAIGMLVGAVGIGGILLPSALTLIAGIAIHQSMATALMTFIFTGLAGTLAFQRRGSIAWPLAHPVALGAALSGWAGAWAGSLLAAPVLSLLLAGVITAAGLVTLTRRTGASGAQPHANRLLLLGAGAVTGFVSGLTGVGGPVLSVPLMLACGFPALSAIGVGQVIQVVGALSGTAANLRLGTIDFGLAALVAVFEMAGVFIGAHLIHRIDVRLATRAVGAACIAAGAVLLWRSALPA